MAIIGLQVKGSALCEAARAGHVEIVRVLLQHQAPIDSTRSVDQLTPLQYAALQHHKDVAMALLAAGADPMKLSKDGERAIELLVAEMRKDAPELQPLLAKYLNPDGQPKPPNLPPGAGQAGARCVEHADCDANQQLRCQPSSGVKRPFTGVCQAAPPPGEHR